MSLSRRMITPTVCGLQKETIEDKMYLFITKKIVITQNKQINLL